VTASANQRDPQDLQVAVDDARLDAIEELADLAASYWRSIAEAAYRREPHVVSIHCRAVAAVTRTAFGTVKAIGSPPATRSGAA